MRSKFSIVAAGLLLCASIATAQQLDDARAVVKTLSSPSFKGRGYVANGDKIASAYIAKEFEAAGLQSLNRGSFFQDFNLSVNTFPGEVELKLNGQLLTTAVDYLVDARSPSIKGTFDVVSVKRTDLHTPEKFTALIGRAKGAFLLIDQRSRSEEQPEVRDRIDAQIDALTEDPSLHIKGLILYTGEKLTWTTLQSQRLRPVMIVNKPDLDPASITRVEVHLDAKFIPEYPTRNVVGMVRGTSGLDSTVVITAHYDHLGMLGKHVYFPGANDNASGVAMLLAFAKHFGAHPPKYNTVFIAFSGEEIGILGSQAFVQHPLIPLSEIKFLINFDLAGTGDAGIKVVNGTIFRDQFDTLVKLNEQYKLVSKVEIRGEACNSDHCRFYAKRVPSFFIYTQGGISAYHDIYDRSETLPLTAFQNYFNLMLKFFEYAKY